VTKLIADKATGSSIGVKMVAGELMLTQVAKATFPLPTQTELFGELARRLLNPLRRTAKK
jgi:dihydrolipoamide dehydrogenase